MYSYKLVFSYLGTHFSGSQEQPNKRTVEGSIREGCARALKSDFSFVTSGRTDSGVHAEAQVGRLRIPNNIPQERLRYCLGRCLPEDIVLKEVSQVDALFHPRFSARSREYHYLCTTEELPFVLAPFVTKVGFPIRFELVRPLLTALLGTHDFGGFRCLGSSEKSTRKTVFFCDMMADSFVTPFSGSVDGVRFRIIADSFLYRMVRSLVGALFEVIQNPSKADFFLDSLSSGRKAMVYALAPAKGLTLVHVGYEKPILW